MAKKEADNNRKGTPPPDSGLWNWLCKRWNWLKTPDKIALIALGVAFLSIVLGAYQLWLGERVVHTNIKPLLDTENTDTQDLKNERLRNYGLDPAVITNIRFYKDGINSKNVYNFLKKFAYNVSFKIYDIRGGLPWYIQKDQEIVLAEINSNDLREQSYNDTQINEILKEWEKAISGVNVEIDYEDVLGEKQKTLQRKFEFRA